MKVQPEAFNILHISDLQAGNICLAEQVGNGAKTKKQIELSYQRYAELVAHDLRGRIKVKPIIIVFTGDIANTGQPTEFHKAKIFLSTLVKSLNLIWPNVLIVPGNHDLNRDILTREYKARNPRKRIKPLACATMKVKMSTFQKWFNSLYKDNAQYRYKMGKPIYFNKTLRKDAVFVGLDTCEGLTYRDKENKGYVSSAQLNEALELFNKYGKDKLRIVLMHHNPFPVLEEPLKKQTGLRNCDEAIIALKNMGVHLILAGHMHRARNVLHHTMTDNLPEKIELNSLITGPCCMNYSGRKFFIEKSEEILPNRYQVLTINPNTGLLSIVMRKFSFEIRAKIDGHFGDWTSDSDLPYANDRGRQIIHIWPRGPRKDKRWERTFGSFTDGFKSHLQMKTFLSHVRRGQA